jgi:hypothetical protein
MEPNHFVTLDALARQTRPCFTKRTHNLNWRFTHTWTLSTLPFLVYANRNIRRSSPRLTATIAESLSLARMIRERVVCG